jgi:arylsulfatase A-like enzyme
MPTLSELTAQKPPPNMDGVSILPALLDGKTFERPPLYFEFHERGFTVAARIGDWKAVRLGTKLPIELYDLKTDAAEQHNVAAQHPEVVKRFEEFLKTARTESEVWPIREDRPQGPAAKKKAKARQP